jgi:N6-L-threonylcarbamoyladenine synthase
MTDDQQAVFLGLDTSCYSTSIALVDAESNLLFERRILLPVASGATGLRQSQAFFYHHKNLPILMQALSKEIDFPLPQRLAGIAVSAKPCQQEASYMPVFLAGTELGQNLSAVLGVPLIETTHQEGHLMAALWSAQLEARLPFLAFHLSGGTTDLIKVEELVYQPVFSFKYHTVLQTSDIPAGQLVDRVGVDLGLDFPAGPALERLAATIGETTPPRNSIPTSCCQESLSFSGAETRAKQLLAAGVPRAELARTIEHCVAGTLEKAISFHEIPGGDIIFMGGVAGNQYIRQRLQHRLNKRGSTMQCHFASSQYSSDNAVGVALIGAASLL